MMPEVPSILLSVIVQILLPSYRPLPPGGSLGCRRGASAAMVLRLTGARRAPSSRHFWGRSERGLWAWLAVCRTHPGTAHPSEPR
jgi:hypothetical protein